MNLTSFMMTVPTSSDAAFDRIPGPRLGRRLFLGGIAAVVALGLTGALAPAGAQSLAEARSQLLVGEMLNGYVGVVQNQAGVQALVDSVNSQRRAEYERLAAQNELPLAVIEQQAGASLVARAQQRGEYYLSGSQWVR